MIAPLREMALKPCAGAPDASVLMPLRNSRAMTEAAITSVLSQQDCTLDVLISDDASNDGTFEAAETCVRSYVGGHGVRLFKVDRRLGIDHLHHLIDRASCRLLIEAHGDDISLPGRMKRLIELYRKTGVSLITSLVYLHDWKTGAVEAELVRKDEEPGRLRLDHCVPPSGSGLLVGARYAFDRAIHDLFPRLDSTYAPSSHDRIQAFRASLLNGVWYAEERLLEYGKHEGQGSKALTDRRSRMASNFGWALRHLSALRVMRKDLRHAAETSLVQEAAAQKITCILDDQQERLLAQLLDNRDVLVRAGQQALWVTEQELLVANARKK